jgi:2-polyprenyl-3-methyl-5-hydroxy-6-metoxy-1,4-benzoquinol methylase
VSPLDEAKRQLYEKYVSSGQAGVSLESVEHIYRVRLPFFRRLIRISIPKTRNAQICEIGCGSGLFLRCLAEQGYMSLSGIDTSHEMVGLARAQGLNFVQQAEAGPFLDACPEQTFDVVVMMDVLEHMALPEQLGTLTRIASILRKPGTLLLHVPNGAGLFGMSIRYGDLTHEAAFTSTSITQLLRAAGFSTVRCYEDVPVVHGFFSALRWLAWQLLSFLPRLTWIAETGNRHTLLTQNMTVVASV